ncbi:MAG: ATP-binding protein, partial [Methanobacterium sp.]
MKKIINVTAQKDHFSKISKASLDKALAELIWNGLDADADKVEIIFRNNDYGSTEVIIKDNGYGIEYSNVEALFGSLGGSWKSHKDKTEKGRFLHGKEGQGRFKAFSIGRVVIWKVIYKKDQSFYEYQIECHSDDPERCTITGEIKSSRRTTGVEICISELDKKSGELNDTGKRKLLSILALYLIKYPSIIIYINSEKLTIDELIRNRKTINLNDIEHQKINYSVELDILEWTDSNKKELLFCGEKGFVLDQYSNSLKVSTDLSFSAFIKSSLVDKLNTDNTLALGDLEPSLKPVIDNAILELKKYFLTRAVEESQLEIEKWKQEDIYPYTDEAITPVEDAERKMFDIVAVNIKRNLPSFDKNDKQGKKFQLRMLRQAIERSPKELQVIIEEVLQLPADKRTELAELLRETKLASIISASTIVSDRLKFISGLETLIFDPESKKYFKERSQLHK